MWTARARSRRSGNAEFRTRRAQFVDEGFEEFAYEDSELPISEGQTISQPFIVAHMIGAADIEPFDRVLEAGTGSGYAVVWFDRTTAVTPLPAPNTDGGAVPDTSSFGY